MQKSNILVILTGGTICSAPKAELGNKNQSNVAEARQHIIADFESSSSPFSDKIELETKALIPDILSENMTVDAWNRLVALLQTVEWNAYAGIILLHGTDTLAYTAALLSMLLSGAPIPIMLVSSQLPLMRKRSDGSEEKETRTNGYANFRAAVELIGNGIAPNVYAVYRNMDGKMLVHYGAHLLQCQNYSNDFHSRDEMQVSDPENARLAGRRFGNDSFYLNKIGKLSPSPLLLFPYVGLDYSRIDLTGVSAIVHATYHSDTVCTERKERAEAYGSASVLSLIDRCKEADIPLFLAPCDKEAYTYASTGDALDHGASYIPHTTIETAYAKVLVGVSLGNCGADLEDFLRTEINHERLF